MTGLVNRVLFTDRLDHALERQNRDHGTLAVMLCDLDDFKSVNDTLGHLAGDEVLKQVASRLQSSVRQADTIARFGGDEFALLIENVESTEDAIKAVERVGQMLRTPLNVAETELKMSASVGIVLTAVPGASGQELLRDADIALYEAKYSGKSCYRFFESSMLDGVVSRTTAQERARISRKPSRAADASLPADPQRTHRAHDRPGSAHALAAPEPRASVPDVLHRISQKRPAPSCRWERPRWTWRAPRLRPGAISGISCPMISVNLSARQLHHRGVVEMVERSLDKYGLPPGDLTIEITESVTMGGVDQAIDRLQQLKDLGVSIAIDDFGTGWSSLSYLRRLPVDFVKFDRTFTADVATDQDAALLISLMNKPRARTRTRDGRRRDRDRSTARSDPPSRLRPRTGLPSRTTCPCFGRHGPHTRASEPRPSASAGVSVLRPCDLSRGNIGA